MGSIKGELRGFRRFASFMYDRFPEVKHFTEISRDMIEDYLVYIKTDTGLTSVSYTTELSVLDNLLDEIGRELEIGNICNLFLSSDCRAYDNALPEAYSDAEILSLIHIYKSVQYIFCDGYFGGIHFYLFLNNKILNLQPIEADGYKKLLITMSAKTDSCENLL